MIEQNVKIKNLKIIHNLYQKNLINKEEKDELLDILKMKNPNAEREFEEKIFELDIERYFSQN